MKVEERIISNLNSAQMKKAKGGRLLLKEQEKKRATDLLAMMKEEGLVAWYQFQENLLEYELRSHDYVSSFSKIVSVHPKKRWSMSWLDLKKREKGRPVMPFRTAQEKREKQAPSMETLILKTEKGWMTEKRAFLNHVGGVVSYRIFSSF